MAIIVRALFAGEVFANGGGSTYASLHGELKLLSSCRAGFRMLDGVALAEHDAVDRSV